MAKRQVKTTIFILCGFVIIGVFGYYLFRRYFKTDNKEKIDLSEIPNPPLGEQNYSVKKCAYCGIETCGCGAKDYK